ncbi:hypothetical protein [Vibrio vulnificus YJ016]|uniref:Uncharacterized protein n=1 Tax=Vibrio vulnificus (strain YJ016) TaxID=196600 RepID=Q7MCC4_VIBVY|nr:hypothetical protein [Vibrio vulnificus YJ016]
MLNQTNHYGNIVWYRMFCIEKLTGVGKKALLRVFRQLCFHNVPVTFFF